ncbi:AAA family ATPase [Azohydromonas australica]|uniref:AAA family ATPase n=1 Tax=Azohydromonas australica TaxID=364039 RepID=UPI00040C85B9|nr:AAA family ATPase [Azohydromonas australica]
MSHIAGDFIVNKVVSLLPGGCLLKVQDYLGNKFNIKYNWPKDQALAPVEGETYYAEGNVGPYRDNHGNIHQQIAALILKRIVTSGSLIIPWLKRLPGIGDAMASRLLAVFGVSLPEVLADASRMEEVAKVLDPLKPNLALSIAAQVYAAAAKLHVEQDLLKAELEFLHYLEELGVTDPRVARRMWRLLYGTDAKERLTGHPYLAASLVGWNTADHIGRKLLRAQGAVHGQLGNHPARQLGALASCWRELWADGSTAATPEQLEPLLERRGVDPRATITLALQRRAVGRSGGLLRAPGASWIEDDLTQRIEEMERSPIFVQAVHVPVDEALHRGVYDAETSTGLPLHSEQHDAVVQILTRPFAALQGPGGAGKTTTIKVLARCWEHLGGHVVLAAPTGKAALLLQEGASAPNVRREAYTVAFLITGLNRLKAALEGKETRRIPKPRPWHMRANTLLVIDEASMLDTPTLRELLSLMPYGARLLLVGDHGQLPSVGPGKVFHDVVADETRVSALKIPRRAVTGSPIPAAADAVREGRVPELPVWSGQDEGIFLAEPQMTLESVYETVRRWSKDVLVAAARKQAVDHFNQLAANACRPVGARIVRLSARAYLAVGDPVVCTQNWYKHGLRNGTFGRVIDIDEKDRVKILWDGFREPLQLPDEVRIDVELAYCVTCHKAQGAGARHVIVLMEKTLLVTREWLYTAITRARQHVVMVGPIEHLVDGVARRESRVTGFRLPLAPDYSNGFPTPIYGSIYDLEREKEYEGLRLF